MTRGDGWLRLEWLRDKKKQQVVPLSLPRGLITPLSANASTEKERL